MKDVIEIYTKILVAFYGFVAPSFTLLISVFIEGISKQKAKQLEELRTIKQLTLIQVNEGEDTDFVKQMNISTAKLNKSQKNIQKKLNLLDPQRQVIRIFAPLTISLVMVAAYHFERTNCFALNKTWIKALTLATSFCCYVATLSVIWQVFSVIINTKLGIVQERDAEVLVPVESLKP